jgi:hypothetical protein
MIEFVFSYKAELQRTALALLVAIAWWRGAGPEKASATALLVFLLQDPLDWLMAQPPNYSVVLIRDAALDCVVGGTLLAIAMRANRIYTLFLAAWQLLAIFAHLGRLGTTSSAALAYAIVMYIPGYLLLFTFGCGLLAHVRRVRRWGPYRSWWNNCPPWKPATSVSHLGR